MISMSRYKRSAVFSRWRTISVGCLVSALYVLSMPLYANESTLAGGHSGVMLLMANGAYDPEDPHYTPPDFNHFVTEIMEWDSAQVAQFEADARAFFLDKFGVDVDDPEYQGRVAMVPFMLDPRWEYRLYTKGKKFARKNGFVVRDGGFQLVVLDPCGIELGGEFSGQQVAQGAAAAFGIFNIDVQGRNELVMPYQSREPVLQNSGFPLMRDQGGVLIAPFDVFHPELGHGWGFAHIWETELDDGRRLTNNRNVITFPAGVSFPNNN